MARPRDVVWPEFEWDEHNEDKLLDNHNVSALEAEQCFLNRKSMRRAGSDYLLLGKTNGDRMLALVYELKERGLIRVYSAREMTDRERNMYRRLAQ